MMRYIILLLLAVMGAMPCFAEGPSEKEVLCKTFVERAIPEYLRSGLDGIVEKNKGKAGLHCKPMFPIPAQITEEQFKQLREGAYRSCVDDPNTDAGKIKELLAAIPSDC